jgi:hypothetical protein
LVVRAAVTVAFATIGVVHLVRCLAGSPLRCFAGSPLRPGGVDRVNELVHLLMSVEMIAMVWRGPLRDPGSLQLTVFAVATGWFLVQAIAPLPIGSVMTGAGDVPNLQCRAAPARRSPRAVRARAACVQHAIIAAVMTWMIAAMPAVSGPVAMGSAGYMAGTARSTASAAVDATASRSPGAWLGGYLLLSASWWLVAGHRSRRPVRPSAPGTGRPMWVAPLVSDEPVAGAISYAVMAAGMGAVLLADHVLAAP